MSNFIVQFPLVTEPFQEDILNKRFEIGRKIYNSLINITQKRYKEMVKTKRYRSILSQLIENKNDNSAIYKQINQMRKAYGLTEYSFHADVKAMQKHFSDNIDSFTAQKIATNLWKAYVNFFYDNGKTIHYKKCGTMSSLEGKSNASGIKFKNNTLLWNGLVIPVQINSNNHYEAQVMQNKISYCRIIRKCIRGHYKYYLQIVLKGTPPVKTHKNTGEMKRPISIGNVGLDIGTQTIAIVSQTDAKLIEIADRVQNIEYQKRILLRKLDRSRRSTNPDNYNPDGTIKRQGNKKVVWINSKHYIKYKKLLRELYRKQADIRKLQHEQLANFIIAQGDTFYVEEMNYKALQKRSTKTEKNDKGKFKKKKRFGKSLANKAPAMLLTIIDRKLQYHGKSLIKIDTRNARASQFNHIEETYKKKKLSQRWNNLGGIKVQRDLYSAFLISNINDDLKTFNIEKCNSLFESFLILHNKEVQRLTGNKNLSSIAV